MFDKNDVTAIPVSEGAGPKANEAGETFQDDETRAEEQMPPQETGLHEELGRGWEVKSEKKKIKLKLPKGFGKKAATVGSGVVGALGLGATIFEILKPVQAFPNEAGELDDPLNAEPAPVPEATTEVHVEPHEMDVATSVDDDMSFGEAFAAARHEVGAGGLFVWHGHTYGTYYANEWNSMSAEDQQQYWSNVHHTVSQIEIEPEEVDVADNDVNDAETAEPSDGTENVEATDTDETPEAEVSEEAEAEPVADEELVEASEELVEAEVEVVEAEPIMEDDIIEAEVEGVDVEVEPIADGELVGTEVEVVEAEVAPEVEASVEIEDAPELEASVEVEAEAEVASEVEVEPVDFDEEPIDIVDDVPTVDDDYSGVNLDVDDMAIIDLDPDVPIDNDMDMNDFV